MSRSPLIALHITKTAGGTLKTALRDAPGKSVEFVYGEEDKLRLSSCDLSTVDMVYGHAIFGLHNRLRIAPDYMCFVRHPVTRTISHFYHLQKVEKGPVGDRIRKAVDIDDFFQNHRHWEFSNLMTRIVSGLGNAPIEDGPKALDQAIANIEAHFRFVGFQEYFPLSVRRMAQVLDFRVSIEKDVNVGRYSLSDVAPGTIDRIEALNSVDMDLYRYCLNRFL